MKLMGLGFVVVGVVCAMVVGMGSNQNAGGVEEIVIDAGFHHLGDNFIPSWVVPDPEGTILEITFSLTQGHIQSTKTAHLELFLLDNDWSNVLVNGRPLSLPYTGATASSVGLDIAAKTLWSIPKSFFDQGVNSIIFESTPHGNNFDDFEIGEIVLVLNK